MNCSCVCPVDCNVCTPPLAPSTFSRVVKCSDHENHFRSSACGLLHKGLALTPRGRLNVDNGVADDDVPALLIRELEQQVLFRQSGLQRQERLPYCGSYPPRLESSGYRAGACYKPDVLICSSYCTGRRLPHWNLGDVGTGSFLKMSEVMHL